MKLDDIHKSMLLLGLSDYMHLGDPIFRIIGGYSWKEPLPESVREQSLKVLYELLSEGMIEAGDLVNRDPEFEPWNLTPEETMDRIESEWNALPEGEIGSFLAWFRLTPVGEKIAQEIRKQVDES